MSKRIEELDAKKEEMLLFQILEEHIEKDKKYYSPCQKCIRLGLNKGFKLGRKLAEKDFKELIDKLGHDDLIEKEELKKELGKI